MGGVPAVSLKNKGKAWKGALIAGVELNRKMDGDEESRLLTRNNSYSAR